MFVLGSNTCGACVNTKCHSCAKPTVCEVCRYSIPARELPLCVCPDGYYDAAKGHDCLLCASKCVTCDNG